MQLPVSPLADLRTLALDIHNEALLQRFFEANPVYFQAVHGQPAQPTEAHEEIHDEPPADMPYARKWVFGYAETGGELAAMANVITDLLAPGVWHIGTFIVATARHGRGHAQALYRGLEHWALQNGAHWLRLGVVQGHARAERFWARQGYVELRRREGLVMGAQTNTVRVMLKPLPGADVAGYLACVERDRPPPAEGA